jgi:hypothetical protein
MYGVSAIALPKNGQPPQVARVERPVMPDRVQDDRRVHAGGHTPEQGEPPVPAPVRGGQFVKGGFLFRRLRLNGRRHGAWPPIQCAGSPRPAG